MLDALISKSFTFQSVVRICSFFHSLPPNFFSYVCLRVVFHSISRSINRFSFDNVRPTRKVKSVLRLTFSSVIFYSMPIFSLMPNKITYSICGCGYVVYTQNNCRKCGNRVMYMKSMESENQNVIEIKYNDNTANRLNSQRQSKLLLFIFQLFFAFSI